MDEFTLEEVVHFGGDKADFEMLKNVNEKSATKGASLSVPLPSKNFEVEISAIVKGLGLSAIDHSRLISESTTADTLSDAEEDASPGKQATEARRSGQARPAGNRLKGFQLAEAVPPSSKMYKTLLTNQERPWYKQVVPCEGNEPGATEHKNTVESFHQRAEELLHREIDIYQTARSADQSSDSQWLRTVFKSGTLSDKVAAHAMMLQESCVHHMNSLDVLVSMAKKKGKRETLAAIDSLKHVWAENVLPDRKLRHFQTQPLSQLHLLPANACDGNLLLWAYEDFVKAKYKDFVDGLQNLAQDPLPNIRIKILGIIYALLSTKPEEEQRLLTMLVNKLGDPDRKVASQSSYLLTQLISKHPNMKLVVVDEVERLLYRSNVAEKAQYYAICFLNQFVLSRREANVAGKLVSIYFSFFKSLTGNASANPKMLSALISGVNRAFPYTEGDCDKFDEQIGMLFKISHLRNLTTSVQALMLLFQVMDARKSVSDRYYQSLYGKLLDHDLSMSLKLPIFLNLLYKSMKGDPLLHRLKAFVKRIMQVCDEEQPSFVCGALILVSEIIKHQPALKALVAQPEEADEEEHFHDLPDPSGDAADNPTPADRVTRDDRGTTTASQYNMVNRNPLYAGAQYACAWETNALRRHYHPSVAHFADCIIQGKHVEYSGDPLQDFTLKRFVDKFTYKNPKKEAKAHGSSVMQPQSVSSRLAEQPVNSPAFLNRAQDKIPLDELFFYKYFKGKTQTKDTKRVKQKKTLQPDENEDDAEDDAGGDDADRLDFARNMEEFVAPAPKAKRRRGDDDDDDGDDGSSDDLSGEEFRYSDMDDEVSDDEAEEGVTNKKPKWTDRDYEKALLDNLSSDSDAPISEDDDAPAQMSTGLTTDSEALFASAEKFSHLLEDTAAASALSKQDKWELGQHVPSFNSTMKRRQRRQDNRGPRGASDPPPSRNGKAAPRGKRPRRPKR